MDSVLANPENQTADQRRLAHWLKIVTITLLYHHIYFFVFVGFLIVTLCIGHERWRKFDQDGIIFFAIGVPHVAGIFMNLITVVLVARISFADYSKGWRAWIPLLIVFVPVYGYFYYRRFAHDAFAKESSEPGSILSRSREYTPDKAYCVSVVPIACLLTLSRIWFPIFAILIPSEFFPSTAFAVSDFWIRSIHVAVGLIALPSGIGLLRRRQWGWKCFQVWCFVNIALMISFAAWAKHPQMTIEMNLASVIFNSVMLAGFYLAMRPAFRIAKNP